MRRPSLCTTCDQSLPEFGVFVRTALGFRHAACPPDPATVGQRERAPSLDDKTPRERRSAAMRKLWDRRREERAAAIAAEDTARSSRSAAPAFGSAPDEDLSLYEAAIAPPDPPTTLWPRSPVKPAAKSEPPAPPAPEPVAAAMVAEDETDDTGEKCVRCGRGLGAVGYWIGAVGGRRHSVCPRRSAPPVLAPAPPPVPTTAQPKKRLASHAYRPGRASR